MPICFQFTQHRWPSSLSKKSVTHYFKIVTGSWYQHMKLSQIKHVLIHFTSFHKYLVNAATFSKYTQLGKQSSASQILFLSSYSLKMRKEILKKTYKYKCKTLTQGKKSWDPKDKGSRGKRGAKIPLNTEDGIGKRPVA